MDNIIVFRSGKFFLLHGAEEIEVENPELAVIKSNGFLRLIDRKNVFFKSTKRIVQENEPIKWEGGFEIIYQYEPHKESTHWTDCHISVWQEYSYHESKQFGLARKVARLIAPVKEEKVIADFAKKFVELQQPIDPEISKAVQKGLWDVIKNENSAMSYMEGSETGGTDHWPGYAKEEKGTSSSITKVEPVPSEQEKQEELTFTEYLRLIGADETHAAAVTIWKTLKGHNYRITRK